MRSLHVVDIENLLGGREDEACFAAIFTRFCQLSGWASGDHVAIAANHKLAAQIAFDIAIPHRFLVASGAPDAADHCLLDFVAGDWVEQRFDRVVIASGDGIFVGLAERCRAAGLKTVIVSRRGSLSRSLAAVADRVRILDPVPLRVPAVSRPGAGDRNDQSLAA